MREQMNKLTCSLILATLCFLFVVIDFDWPGICIFGAFILLIFHTTYNQYTHPVNECYLLLTIKLRSYSPRLRGEASKDMSIRIPYNNNTRTLVDDCSQQCRKAFTLFDTAENRAQNTTQVMWKEVVQKRYCRHVQYSWFVNDQIPHIPWRFTNRN